MKRDLISSADLSAAEYAMLLDSAAKLKSDYVQGVRPTVLAGKLLALLFEKPSLRTRLSFEAAMLQLGGTARFLGPTEVAMGKRESVPDVARTAGLYTDGVAARIFGHEVAEQLAKYCPKPVINALSDDEHPCQILADLLTLRERFGRIEGVTVAYVGDSNNITNSLIYAAPKVGLNLIVSSPADYQPRPEVLARATADAGGRTGWIETEPDPNRAVATADAVYADSWYSMGQENEAAHRRQLFKDYQINSALMSHAPKRALVMHCLPAHRGDEITDEVMDGEQSIVFHQAENRLHAQKAVLAWLLGGQN
ncbi:MAG: ornithine carbamoyltransferase [Chloroflexota bacterium]